MHRLTIRTLSTSTFINISQRLVPYCSRRLAKSGNCRFTSRRLTASYSARMPPISHDPRNRMQSGGVRPRARRAPCDLSLSTQNSVLSQLNFIFVSISTIIVHFWKKHGKVNFASRKYIQYILSVLIIFFLPCFLRKIGPIQSPIHFLPYNCIGHISMIS